ncbi:DUF4230 domain-containing protein [Alloprevotella tannerae]|uniref:DUF4230 domain-containing protein n=1 Tax=Alloprevotella tannerae TaxID=76122 RepID=UPI001EDAB1B6|nr:DUF4230 domain-containing protein [Alloprevotella tannerae]MCG2651760.1 DUF4230 domain-containing protein [Alloprevotella tannerae]
MKGRQDQTKSYRLKALAKVVFYIVVKFRYLWLILLAIVIVALCLRQCRDEWRSGEGLHVSSNKQIDVSPEEIRKIKDIGQWEFLAIRTEELAELDEKALLGDKQLAQIYTGTVRLGIDMKKAPDDWFTAKGDTAVLYLPTVGLLDKNFIDEAQTKAFYEKGTWRAEDKNKLYALAYRKMMARCLTVDNLRATRQQATVQFSQIFFAFGYKYVIINYGSTTQNAK